MSGRVPMVLPAPLTATNFVLLFNKSVTALVGNSPVFLSISAHLTVAPRDSAACTQGRIFES